MPERRRRPHTSQPAPAQSARPGSTVPRADAREVRRGAFRFPGVGAWAAFLVGAWVMRLLSVFVAMSPGFESPVDTVLIVLTATVAAMGWRYAARERLARARAARARGSAGTR
jgi:hypothetical protein